MRFVYIITGIALGILAAGLFTYGAFVVVPEKGFGVEFFAYEGMAAIIAPWANHFFRKHYALSRSKADTEER